jgi:hypothetical protein
VEGAGHAERQRVCFRVACEPQDRLERRVVDGQQTHGGFEHRRGERRAKPGAGIRLLLEMRKDGIE